MGWYTSGDGRIELEIEYADADEGYHPGQCEHDVMALSKKPYIAEQLAKIDPMVLRNELKQYGAWDEEELSDHEENIQRILWLACGDIVEMENEETA